MYNRGAHCIAVFLQSHVHYADLGDFKKEKTTAIPPIPLEKVVYASITHERTYGNVGDKKREGMCYFMWLYIYVTVCSMPGSPSDVSSVLFIH